MNAIGQFLDKLKAPHRSFGIKGLDLSTCKAYPYEEYDCEISLLHQCSFKRDINNPQLIQTFKEIFSKEYLELHHPIYNNILTRAVLSFNNSLVQNGSYYNSFIFFIDEKNQYPWILVNENMFARILITPENLFLAKDLFGIQDFAKWILWLALAEIPKIAQNLKEWDLKFCDKKFGINLGNARPYHFFKEDLYWFLKLDLQDCNVLNTSMFFKIKEIKNITNEERLGIRPSLLCDSDCFNSALSANIVYQSLANNANNGGGGAEDMYSLTLWLGIPGERRIWLEQWQGIPLILKNLSLYFPSIKVYVDGMTAYDGERIEVTNNLEAFFKIVENTKEVFEMDSTMESFKQSDIMDCHENQRFSRNDVVVECKDAVAKRKDDPKNTATIVGAKGEIITLKSLSGYDYRTKICYCSLCDVVISETSTTALVPFHFCKKPGIAFYCVYQDDAIHHLEEAQKFASQIPALKVPSPRYHAYENGQRRVTFCFNYHFPPEHFYNLIAQSLEELSLKGKIKGYDKSLKMHRLPVPPVELYANLYELEKKTKVALKGNKAELEILGKIESQKKLLEMQNLLSEIDKNETAQNPKKPKGAKERIHNHLAYKLGLALIVCSKSLWGYIQMPYVLSHTKAQHRFEQEKYQRAITRNPHLKLPKLESYADYQDALKEKQCYTYKLGEALIEADKTWLKGGYLWFYLESKRLKREFEKERR